MFKKNFHILCNLERIKYKVIQTLLVVNQMTVIFIKVEFP